MIVMEHIRQFDWCSFGKESSNFLEASDIDNCIIEKVLRGKFVDPLISSDSDEEPVKINWDTVFSKRNKGTKGGNTFVAGLKAIASYPKQSALTALQHSRMLTIFAADSNLTSAYPKPTDDDFKLYRESTKIYEEEKKEYLKWAQTLWSSIHNVAVLRPKPIVEEVYEATFNVCQSRHSSLPKHYEMAAQIPLDVTQNSFKMIHEKDIVSIDDSELLEIMYPPRTWRYTILKNRPTLPQICRKHPCPFILPDSRTITSLTMHEIQNELTHFGAANDAQFVISENAICCLLEQDRPWMLYISVRPAIYPDGKTRNVIVISKEMYVTKHTAGLRNYIALKHLLEVTLVPQRERKLLKERENSEKHQIQKNKQTKEQKDMKDLSSDEEEDVLFIDYEEAEVENKEENSQETPNSTIGAKCKKCNDDITCSCKDEMEVEYEEDIPNSDKFTKSTKNLSENNDFQAPCSCKDTTFKIPSLESYKKWKISNISTNENLSLIVHCSHKIRNRKSEVILEPIPEYQLVLGATTQNEHKLRSLVMSLYLRQKASLINVRLDGVNGDIVTFDVHELDDVLKKHGSNLLDDSINILHTTLSQLQRLLPGEYILEHKIKHGPNAVLFVARNLGGNGPSINLNLISTEITDEEEVAHLEMGPTLGSIVLPYHIHHKLLPLAFSPYPEHVAKETKTAQKLKVPPPAIKFGTSENAASDGNNDIKWPKKKAKKRRKGRAQNT